MRILTRTVELVVNHPFSLDNRAIKYIAPSFHEIDLVYYDYHMSVESISMLKELNTHFDPLLHMKSQRFNIYL